MLTENTDQADTDLNGLGDACNDDEDADGDDWADGLNIIAPTTAMRARPTPTKTALAMPATLFLIWMAMACWMAPITAPKRRTREKEDLDGNGVGDACSADADGDGVQKGLLDCDDQDADLGAIANDGDCDGVLNMGDGSEWDVHVIVDDTDDTPEGADSVRSVFALDVDSDGDVDVLSASWNDDKIAWYENDGDENFTLRVIVDNTSDTPESANGARDVYAVDIDDDGDVDVLSASYFTGKIVLYENDGEENFTLNTIGTRDQAYGVYALDVDGDGDVDVLSASLW